MFDPVFEQSMTAVVTRAAVRPAVASMHVRCQVPLYPCFQVKTSAEELLLVANFTIRASKADAKEKHDDDAKADEIRPTG
jgi:hypothetical protein